MEQTVQANEVMNVEKHKNTAEISFSNWLYLFFHCYFRYIVVRDKYW